MNANELMIGDWYLASEQHSTMDGDYTLEFYPKRLTIDDLVFARDNDWYKIEWDEFTKPIPLTTEILEKNGWYHDGIFMERRANENIQLSWTDRCGAVLYKNSYEMCDCKYVHELQHALRLCRLDDLANNFKI